MVTFLLVYWSPRINWVQAGVIVLCSWARHFTLTVPRSNQELEYKWLPDKMLTLPMHTVGVDISLAASCYRNRTKRRLVLSH